MKIGSFADKPAAAATPAPQAAATPEHAKAAQGSATHGADKPAQPDASAKVELSSTAATLLSSSSGTSEFDAEKVARISQAINAGTFQVNPTAIADKLIGNAQELLTKAKS